MTEARARHGGPVRRRLTLVAAIVVALSVPSAAYAITSASRTQPTDHADHAHHTPVGWVRATTPGGLGSVFLHGVTCAGASCLAIGARCAAIVCTGFSPQFTLSSTDHGATWRREGVPAHFGFAYQGATCVSARRCVAGGTLDPQSTKPVASIATTTNLGATWTTAPITGLGIVITTVCPSATICYAVGYANPPVSQVAFGQIAITRNGGASWSVRALPATGEVNGITCRTPSVCTAFATSLDGGTTILERTTNAGGAWSATPVPAGVGLVRWLTCPTATTCVATSNRTTNLKSIDVTHDAGATWTARSIGLANVLYAASCASGTTCEFVGQSLSLPLTSTSVDGGRTWPLVRLTRFGHGRLWSISCAPGNHCVAVGQWWTGAPGDGGPLLLHD